MSLALFKAVWSPTNLIDDVFGNPLSSRYRISRAGEDNLSLMELAASFKLFASRVFRSVYYKYLTG
jgi:hypothetical protein